MLPAGWVAEMSRPSRVNAETGLQLRTARRSTGSTSLSATDEEGSAFWVIPSRQLVVLDVAGQGEQPLDDLPALLLRALVAPGAN